MADNDTYFAEQPGWKFVGYLHVQYLHVQYLHNFNHSFPRDITSMWPSHIFTSSSLYEAPEKKNDCWFTSVLRAGDSSGKVWGLDTERNTGYECFFK